MPPRNSHKIRKDITYKGEVIHPVGTSDPRHPYYRVWGLGTYSSVAAAKRAINAEVKKYGKGRARTRKRGR